MRVLSLVPARHPAAPPAPPASVTALTSGPAPGLGFSLLTHAAMVAAVVGGPRVAGGPAATPPPADVRETLLWVGLDAGGGGGVVRRAPRSDERPPIAYYVPGAAGGPGATRGGRGPGGASPGLTPSTAPTALPTRAPAAVAARVTVPEVAVPEAEVARLVAGVVAAVRDQTRRAVRPDAFVPTTLGGVLTQVGALAPVGITGPQVPLPIPLASNPVPEYPAELAREGVGGRVVVEFLIDSTGAVDAASLRVVESGGAALARSAFAEAVRRVLPRLRFVPGQLNDHAVGVTVRQPFLFVARR